ncbi:MAG: TRAP transporter small permease [Pseudomonadota bacterium]
MAKLSSALGEVEDWLNIVAAVTIFVVMLGTVISIVTRIVWTPIPGYLDVSELSIAIFAFLGVAYAQRHGAHIRMEMVIGAVPERLRWLVEAIGSLAALALVLLLLRYSWDFFVFAWENGDSTVDYEIPTWPAKLLVPVAFAIWALRLTIESIGWLRLALFGGEPVAVPMPESAEDQARREAQME